MDNRLADNSRTIFPFIVEAFEILNAGREKNDWPRQFLEALRSIAGGLQRNLKEIWLISDESSVMLTTQAASMLEALLATDQIYFSSLRGRVEYLNIHDSQNTFRIYPIVGPNFVTCKFKSEVKPKVKEAMDRYAEVTGKFFAHKGEDGPYQIEVENIEAFPDDASLPSIYDIKGIAKAPEGMSAEEMLQKERDGDW
jgi:hypothetical protein